MAAYGKKAQTEKKAKGLVKGIGDYKGKTLNLTKKQLGKAGTAAAQKRTVDISATKFEAGSKKVLGPGGKPLTGTVDLGGGNMAVYRNGVRVRAAAPKPASSPKTSTASQKPRTPKADASMSKKQKDKIIKDKKTAAETSVSKRAQSASGARYSGMAKAASSSKSSGSSSTGKKWWEAGGGGLVGPNSPFAGNKSSGSKPKKGDRRPSNSGWFETWNGSRWVRDKQ